MRLFASITKTRSCLIPHGAALRDGRVRCPTLFRGGQAIAPGKLAALKNLRIRHKDLLHFTGLELREPAREANTRSGLNTVETASPPNATAVVTRAASLSS